MIESTGLATQATNVMTSTPALSGGTKGEFDAALKAAERAEARRQARESELNEIREKGFSAWARDMRIEKLKEELRRKAMAALGLSEDDLAKLAPAIRQILEQRIKNEVERQLAAILSDPGADSGGADQEKPTDQTNGTTTRSTGTERRGGSLLVAQDVGTEAGTAATATATATTEDEEEKSRRGKNCPVIPALSTPGGASLF